MVEDSGVEPLTEACKATVFPTIPIPHFYIWCPNRDLNSDACALASKTSVSTNSTIEAKFWWLR